MTRYYKYDFMPYKFVVYKNIFFDNTRTVNLLKIYRNYFRSSHVEDLEHPFLDIMWSWFKFYKEWFNYFNKEFEKYKCDLFNISFKKSELRRLAGIIQYLYQEYHPKNHYISFYEFDHFILYLNELRDELNRLNSLHPFRLKVRFAPSSAAPMKW